MEKKQIELLERVLLLMKYDNRKTLNENVKTIRLVNEQDSVTLDRIGSESYNEQKRIAKEKEWKPKLKTYKSFWGENIDVPETSKIRYFNLTELNRDEEWPLDGGDGKGFYCYLNSLSGVNPIVYSRIKQDAEKIWAMDPKKIKDIDIIKFYYPSANAMNSMFGSDELYQFVIPKGTMIPYDEHVKENPDDWFSTRNQGEKPLEKDIKFTPVMQLMPNWSSYTIYGKNDGMFNNWSYNVAYYTSDLDSGKLVSYVPELWIQYKSPTKLWWDKYGIWVELVGAVLITILSQGLLAPEAIAVLGLEGALASNAGFILDLFFNGIFNLSIAKMHFDAHDDAAGWMSTAFCFLPLLHKYGGQVIQKYFTGFSQEAILLSSKEVLSTTRGLNLTSKPAIEKWYKGLSETTQQIVKNYTKIPAKEIDTVAKQVLEIGNKLMREARRANPKWMTQHIFTSAAKGFGKFIGIMAIDLSVLEASFKVIEAANGKPFSPAEKINIIMYVSGLSEEGKDFNANIQEFAKDVQDGTVTTDDIVDIAQYQVLPTDTINSYVNTIKKNNPGFDEFIQ